VQGITTEIQHDQDLPIRLQQDLNSERIFLGPKLKFCSSRPEKRIALGSVERIVAHFMRNNRFNPHVKSLKVLISLCCQDVKCLH